MQIIRTTIISMYLIVVIIMFSHQGNCLHVQYIHLEHRLLTP